jgi:uncharacterized RDD family membrane protein YckC
MADPPKPRPSLATRLLGGGARGARAVAEATGIDNTLEVATEEAIVSALESEAVERALIRVLEGPATESAIRGVLASPAFERALTDAIDSKLVDKVWEQLLDSDEVQKLIERIAEAPEVRAAITSQGVGLIEDLGRQVRRIAHRLDGVVERFARRLARKPARTEPSDNAGFVTRALGLAIDAAIINGAFFALSAGFTFLMEAVFGKFDTSSAPALALGTTTFIAILAGYLLFFWTLAGQTLGMRLLGIRIIDFDADPHLDMRTAVRRLLGFVLSVLTLGLGFLAVLVSDRRRGLMDGIANTEVILVDRDGQPESAARRAALESRY